MMDDFRRRSTLQSRVIPDNARLWRVELRAFRLRQSVGTDLLVFEDTVKLTLPIMSVIPILTTGFRQNSGNMRCGFGRVSAIR